MGLLDALSQIKDVIIDQITTPKSFKTGQKFEKYIIEHLFPTESYALLEMTHDYKTNKKYFVEASLNPDFKFRDKRTGREFYVEAKFRSQTYNDKIIWCNEQQLKRYQNINQKTPVFLLLGNEGTPNRPDYLSLIPIEKAKYTGLFTSLVDKFAIEFETAITSNQLWKL